MKPEQQYADDLIEKYYNKFSHKFNITTREAISYAIIDVENTIEALDEVSKYDYVKEWTFDYYQNVLQILKDKL